MSNLKHSFMVLLVALLGACAPKVLQECMLPPQGFGEPDLVGTWVGLDAGRDNTITIRGDGMYRQIMYEKRTGFRYESDWKSWRITYSDKGLPYLHFKGFLMCAYWNQIDCATGSTSITPAALGDTKDPFVGEYYWYDGCQKKWVDTPGEAVFTVRGTMSPFPRQITLVPFRKSSDTNTGPAFVLREP